MKDQAPSGAAAYLVLDRVHPDFATKPIAEACNWDEFAALTDLDHWYQVVFRSKRKPQANGAVLEQLGEAARQDASRQPGYLFYFKGNVEAGSDPLRNLSFCMWQSRSEAEAAATRKSHQSAIAGGIDMYEEYFVERYNARVHRENQRPRVEFVPI